MAPKELKTETIPDIRPKTKIIFPNIKPKTETIFPDKKLKTETIFPNIKQKTETFFPDTKPKTGVLHEIQPAIKPFPINEPLPDLKKCDDWLDNWINNSLNDNVDHQIEIFVDDNYLSWTDDDNKPDIKTDAFLPVVDGNADGQTEIFVDDN